MSVARKDPRRHHHGDLRRALLDAVAEAVLELGAEAVSLRDCARRAGVAHSAAAPHFGDKRGLLTAFAAEGFAQLGAAQEAEMAAAGDGAAQLLASGRGYLAFARAAPGHFRLMFRAALLDRGDPALLAAQARAWQPLARAVALGAPQLPPAERHSRMALAWAGVHGHATLAAEGAGEVLRGGRPPEEAEAAFLDGLVAACLAGG